MLKQLISDIRASMSIYDAAEDESYGLLAEFSDPGALYHAAKGVRNDGYRRYDVYSPFPIHGMDKAMGMGTAPPVARPRTSSFRLKRSKACSTKAPSKPSPSSVMTIWAKAPLETLITTSPPAGEWRTALSRRLRTTRATPSGAWVRAKRRSRRRRRSPTHTAPRELPERATCASPRR